MEEFSSIQHKEIGNQNIDNERGLTEFFQLKNSLQKWTRRIIVFICYVPGVFVFLWLIGRILRR